MTKGVVRDPPPERASRRKQGTHHSVRNPLTAYAELPRPLPHEGPAGHLRKFIRGDRNVAKSASPWRALVGT